MPTNILPNKFRKPCRQLSWLCCLAICAWSVFIPRCVVAETIQFHVNDSSGSPLACRIHLKNEAGDPQRAMGLPFWRDHFVCRGQAEVKLAPGLYTWVIEKGPEWQPVSGMTEVVVGGAATVDIKVHRIASMRQAGWYSADLHVHRPVEDIELLMMAEDLDFAPVITWWNRPAKQPTPVEQTEFRFDGHRLYTVMAGEDEREGGALLYFGLNQPLDLSVESREYPSPMHFVQQARQLNSQVWIDIEKPFWWDVPTWLATGQMNSIGIANNHMCRDQMLANEAWGKPRDAQRLPNPRGNGYWTQEIYYHLLNAGIRLPPSAGSASGVLPNPVGYNRVYVQLGDEPFTIDAWFDKLSQGRCIVTNGPLLRARVDSSWPGSVLKLGEDQSLTVDLSIQLTSHDSISAVEVIHNGNVVHTIPCAAVENQQLSATLTIDEPGWLLLRTVANVPTTFRFASTAPWYIESQGTPRPIRRTSAKFFLDWVDERIRRIETNVPDGTQRPFVLQWHLQAREFWEQQVANANFD